MAIARQAGRISRKKKEISTGKINFFSRIRRIIFWRPKFVWFFPGNYVCCCFADFRKFRFLFFSSSRITLRIFSSILWPTPCIFPVK